ncbi:craniofacial development protein 2-like [Plakobranchus ocellatus]|uniref:Craniofacial development protein 2-like n=1 Tax=Plakobranchus ocellatus TaxID=259542 RepID=A0AAV4DZW6_9GAST|nr:craniofacial development protein 2-like [Plakobranchus ocellatus]
MSQNHNETLVINVKGVCDSNPNPSFGRDSHVQQVAPGRHPASALKTETDKTSRIAAWNVRTLHQKGKLENVVKEMERMKLYILGLAEVRWTGTGSMKLGSKTQGDTHMKEALVSYSMLQRQKVWELVSNFR